MVFPPLRNQTTRGGDRGGRRPPAAGERPGTECAIARIAVAGGIRRRREWCLWAGLLCGWSEHGTRPVFELVTGVSTGALIAPFAYLGSRYDWQLRDVYTELTPDSVLARRSITAVLFDDAIADNYPLFKTISRYLNEAMLAELAKSYDNGRLLLIGTSDLDAQQPVLWNIGAIAKSGHPRALDTIRRVLLGLLCHPWRVPANHVRRDPRGHCISGVACGRRRLHAGVSVPGRAYAAATYRMADGRPVLPATAYVIRNGRLDPEWASTERRTLSIARRAINTMIAAVGYNDVIRTDNTTLRDGIRVQSGLYWIRLQPDTIRAVRSGIHASLVRLWLPACPPRLRLGESTTRPKLAV